MVRELSADERGLVELMLSLDGLDQGDRLREQVPRLRVESEEPGSITFENPGTPVRSVRDGAVPVSGLVAVPDGDFLGHLTLWVAGGLLDSIDFGWVTQQPPAGFPCPEWVRVEPARRGTDRLRP